MKKIRIILTGCHGLLGQRLVQEMRDDVLVLGVDLHETPHIHGEHFQYAQLDITSRADVKHIFSEFAPNVVINTAAFTDVDTCETEKETCWRVNVDGVKHIAYAAHKLKAKVIQFSTDYIFNSRKEVYTEDDTPEPLNYYGKSKLASENIIKAGGENWAIVRTSTLFDVDTLLDKQNFVTWVIKNLQQGNTIKVVSDQWSNPTLARNLAQLVWNIVYNNFTSVYHAVGRDNTNRFAFAKRIASIFDLNEWLIEEITTEELGQKAQRPQKIGLDISKIESECNIKMLGIEDSLVIFKHDYLEMHRIN